MTDILYKPTLPTEPGRYWWRDTADSEPEVVELRVCELNGAWIGRHFASWIYLGKSQETSRVVGLFGPRVEMPVEKPVEVFAVFDTDNNLLRLAKSEEYARRRMELYTRTYGDTVLKKCVLLVKEIVQ